MLNDKVLCALLAKVNMLKIDEVQIAILSYIIFFRSEALREKCPYSKIFWYIFISPVSLHIQS